MDLVEVSRELRRRVDELGFSEPISHVYNPLAYARRPHEAYLERFGTGRKRVVLVGMNPGPFGMAQTGVPFGDVSMVRDWMGISDKVDRPKDEHPKRPIEGFSCKRSEVSGSRLWGWAKARFKTAETFFERFFVLNYCPLCFMEKSGKNFTPDKLKSSEQAPLFAACDRALARMVKILEPELCVGVGAFAEKRAREALGGTGVTVGTILHPSPANPQANRGWAEHIERQFAALGVRL
jgi:single-strand selective monofunctional uracil DNA glycosylase